MNIRDTDIIYDAKAMTEGYVSVTPLSLDYTETSYWDSIAKWDIFDKWNFYPIFLNRIKLIMRV